MAEARNGTVRLHFELRGDPDRPPLLLVRGLARTQEYWLDLLPALEPHFRLVLMDNRGVGRSSVPRPPYSTRGMADDCASVLDHAGVERAHVFGMSLGGMIAQELALRHPARVTRLVLGCTTPGRRAGYPTPWRSGARLISAVRLSPEDAVARTASLIVSEAYLAEHPEIVDTWRGLARRHPIARRGAIGQMLAALRHDAVDRLARLRVPTLVASGDRDKLIPIENSRWLVGEIPGARFEVLRGAGHDFTTERPVESAELLRRFLTD